jgi:hypothetical protein
VVIGSGTSSDHYMLRMVFLYWNLSSITSLVASTTVLKDALRPLFMVLEVQIWCDSTN